MGSWYDGEQWTRGERAVGVRECHVGRLSEATWQCVSVSTGRSNRVSKSGEHNLFLAGPHVLNQHVAAPRHNHIGGPTSSHRRSLFHCTRKGGQEARNSPKKEVSRIHEVTKKPLLLKGGALFNSHYRRCPSDEPTCVAGSAVMDVSPYMLFLDLFLATWVGRQPDMHGTGGGREPRDGKLS